VPVLISANVPGLPGSPTSGNASITLLEASEILLADDGNLSFDASAETSLQMLTNPTTGATNVVSLYQTNCVGIKAQREINFARAHPDTVIYMVTPY
jgi:hypothetical protein